MGRKEVRPEDNMFVSLARGFKDEIGIAPGNEHPDLQRRMTEYDDRLKLCWSNRSRTFWVCRELMDSEGLVCPIWTVGDDPNTEEVMTQIRDRDLAGKAKERAKKIAEQQAKERAEDLKRADEQAMPHFAEYMSRLRRCDDDGLRTALAREMGAEVKREQSRPA